MSAQVVEQCGAWVHGWPDHHCQLDHGHPGPHQADTLPLEVDVGATVVGPLLDELVGRLAELHASLVSASTSARGWGHRWAAQLYEDRAEGAEMALELVRAYRAAQATG